MKTKSKERIKKFGEVFTPPELVNEILDKLPEEVWKPEKTFCDPSCGDGNFLIEVLKRKISLGHSPTDALLSIYGVEIQEDNAQRCRERLLEIAGHTNNHIAIVNKNIVCHDALTYDYSFGENEI